MNSKIVSGVLIASLCMSNQAIVYASQTNQKSTLANIATSSNADHNIATSSNAAYNVTRDIDIENLTPSSVYDAIIALKSDPRYAEGVTWNYDEPYSDEKGLYEWHGGMINGVNIKADSCVAFAFICSDAAFGELKARAYSQGKFKYEDIKVGDILRMNTDTHTVIVLEVLDDGIIVAEGNVTVGENKGTVHWGRAISKEVVMADTSTYITRYPSGYITPDDTSANEIVDNGSLSSKIDWKLTKNGVLTISGKGDMPDFSTLDEQVWGSDIKKVIIEDGITRIGNNTFWKSNVLSVKIADSVREIGSGAFRDSALISLTVPSSVKTIKESAFNGCSSLGTLVLNEGLEVIEQNAFNACTSLQYLTIPASIKELGAAAFCQCTDLRVTTFKPGNNTVIIGDNLFTRCYYLMEVTLPTKIDKISDGMFLNCLMLGVVKIPDGAESIGNQAFSSCSRLTSLLVPKSVVSIGTAAFGSCGLRDIYYTGSESEWNSVRKLGDTQQAVLKMTIHYNYEDKDDTSGDNGESGDNTGSEVEKPGETEKPGDGEGDKKPEDTTKPGDNEGDKKPEDTEKPGETEKPEDTSKPGDDTTTNKPGGDSGESGDDNKKPDDTIKPGDDTNTNKPDETEKPDDTTNDDEVEKPDDTTNTSKPDSKPNGNSTSSSKSSGGSSHTTNVDSNGYYHGGTWLRDDDKWKLKSSNGDYVKGSKRTDSNGNVHEQVAWAQVNSVWYAFGSDGYAESGWVLDEALGKWYYIDIDLGMQTGWINDTIDGYTYYLDQASGDMLVGWQLIEDNWYYFNEYSSTTNWERDKETLDWIYVGSGNKTYGAMYKNEETPDGHTVNENGVRIK